MPGSDLRLPEGAVLLHIGPHKTGTTSIQGALFLARPGLLERGILHVGQTRHPMTAVMGLTGARGLTGGPAPSPLLWDEIVAQIHDAQDHRVIFSSEFFADANPAQIQEAVHALGGDRVHVVVTLRPLSRIMPSQWQQYVQNRLQLTYDEWLTAVLSSPPDPTTTPSFWKRHHHDLLIEKWASVVGLDNLTVVVIDESDRGSLLRTFEQFLDLPDGLLVLDRETVNRSLTLGEIELVRQMNIEFQAQGWSEALYRRIVREGVIEQLKGARSPLPDEPLITTPQWALDRVAEIGASAAERIAALGARVVGDITTLGLQMEANQQVGVRATYLAPDAARQAIVGTISASWVLDPARVIRTYRSAELMGILWRRALLRLRKTFRAS